MHQKLVDKNGMPIGNYFPDVQWIDRRTGRIHVMEAVRTNPLPEEKMKFYIDNGIKVHTINVK